MTSFNREQSGIGEFASDSPEEPDPVTPEPDSPPDQEPQPS
jgi:hypothetical protein